MLRISSETHSLHRSARDLVETQMILIFFFCFSLWQDISGFTASLVKQMSLNLKRIHTLGINKIAVGLLEPIGCMPMFTAASSQDKCIETFNLVSKNHSQMLFQTVQQLNTEMGKSVFITLDLYNSFLSTIATMKKGHAGKFYLCFHNCNLQPSNLLK